MKRRVQPFWRVQREGCPAEKPFLPQLGSHLGAPRESSGEAPCVKGDKRRAHVRNLGGTTELSFRPYLWG